MAPMTMKVGRRPEPSVCSVTSGSSRHYARSCGSAAMKVLFVTMEYPPDTAIGGIAFNIGGMAPAMVELGHEVHVLVLAQPEA